ncbi:uncharacterized protein BYT42DRAFT_560507 [Radiomyces spectabilis]|uniref:uncharacterized protein n=1 Tax=Radiomyces spectabilis TaxID=64574 RepID=UPI00221EF5D9|nr:uncharacterized protein BYT42DRAFT_560507 [Radiomyces spectabilis]KAI8388558.1 hypothetical protein BYT42DRAFT_560507 [Radiomyces spectabilis]
MTTPSSHFDLNLRSSEASTPRIAPSLAGIRHRLARFDKPRTAAEDIDAFCDRYKHGMPTYPSYLEGSMYALLVQEQYASYRKILPRVNLAPLAGTKDSQRISLLNRSKAMTDITAMNLIMQDLRLPTAWSTNDKGSLVDISEEGLLLAYKGILEEDLDISAVRANFPMRAQCGVYYYEVEVVSKGTDGHIGIGFCLASSSLDRLPGWEDFSWGYHGDDGHLFSGPGTSKPYGPRFGTGDIIGCGIDYRNMTAFYTKNGVHLGHAFSNLMQHSYYPFIGFKTPGEKVYTNFGQKPFKFDIASYMKASEAAVLQTISNVDFPSPSTSKEPKVAKTRRHNTLMQNLVLEYLAHHGYRKSFEALKTSITSSADHDHQDTIDINANEMDLRIEIMREVLHGDIERAISLSKEHYPEVFNRHTRLLFRLKCRHFIRLVQKAHQKLAHTVTELENQYSDLAVGDKRKSIDAHDDTGAKKRRRSLSLGMEIDIRGAATSDDMDTDDPDNNSYLRDAMSYGQKLHSSYFHLAKFYPEFRDGLTATFSILAYADTSHQDVAGLLDPIHVEKLADELNSAIHEWQHKRATSSLEHLYRQMDVIVTELTMGGIGSAALLRPPCNYFGGSQ